MEEKERVCEVEEGCLFRKLGVIPVPTISPLGVDLLKWLIAVAVGALAALALSSFFLMVYPFKTLVFVQPIEIANPGKRVPLLGVVRMRINFIKYIDNPGLVIRTLVRRRGQEMYVLDSSTIVSNRTKGAGITEAVFPLTANKIMVGDDCRVIISVYYTIYWFRNIMVQFETEPFEIYDPGGR